MKSQYMRILVGLILTILTLIPSLILFIFSNICKIIYMIGNKTENFLSYIGTNQKSKNYLIKYTLSKANENGDKKLFKYFLSNIIQL